MKKIRLHVERCKGCYLCLANCKTGALHLSGKTNDKGVEYVEADQETCIGCGCCYAMCPDLVFEIC